jgi:hypothetical protein
LSLLYYGYVPLNTPVIRTDGPDLLVQNAEILFLEINIFKREKRKVKE